MMQGQKNIKLCVICFVMPFERISKLFKKFCYRKYHVQRNDKCYIFSITCGNCLCGKTYIRQITLPEMRRRCMSGFFPQCHHLQS